MIRKVLLDVDIVGDRLRKSEIFIQFLNIFYKIFIIFKGEMVIFQWRNLVDIFELSDRGGYFSDGFDLYYVFLDMMYREGYSFILCCLFESVYFDLSMRNCRWIQVWRCCVL